VTPDELSILLARHGVYAFVRKDEVVVQTCMYCGNDKRNLELNAGLGVFRCWACKTGGRLDQLLGYFFNFAGKIPVSPLVGERRRRALESILPLGVVPGSPAVQYDSAVRYLKSRGLAVRDFVHYGFRVADDDKDEAVKHLYARLIIPALDFWTQQPAGYVARGYVGERPKYLADCVSPIVGYRVNTPGAPYVMSEGLFDGIAVHRAGANAAVQLGQGSDSDFDEWVSRVPKDNPIAILLDGDAQEQSVRLWWKARAIREDVVRVPLPRHLDPGKLDPSVLARLLQFHIANGGDRTLLPTPTGSARSRITYTGELPC
jgi:hypothetical protein